VKEAVVVQKLVSWPAVEERVTVERTVVVGF